MITSCGILIYKKVDNELQVLLGHPGGPFFKNKDAGSWSIPKGELDGDEDPIECALREFKEETSFVIDDSNLKYLGENKNSSGKLFKIWAKEDVYQLDLSKMKSNTFKIEWPPKSGKLQDFPEVEKFEFFTIHEAKIKINQYQLIFLRRLVDQI
jgi:predicted NUDIX family NTP pyrophosphohydrolase